MNQTRRKFIKNLGATSLLSVGTSPWVFAGPDEAPEPLNPMNKEKFTVLFQGDSITDGNRTRNNDWNHIMGHGYAYLIASRLWFDYPDAGLMFVNRGISGNRVKDLQQRWEEDTIALQPDVLSILIGVNDVLATVHRNGAEPHQKYSERLDSLLQTTREKLPDTKLILIEPFVLPLGWVNDHTEVWMSAIQEKQEAALRMSQKHNALFVPLQKELDKACDKAPPEFWIWDGVHPMPAGHELIARQWIQEVQKQKVLPFLND